MYYNPKGEVGKLKLPGLFIPEDTATGSPYKGQNTAPHGLAGFIKFWVWVVLSIIAALALGQLTSS